MPPSSARVGCELPLESQQSGTVMLRVNLACQVNTLSFCRGNEAKPCAELEKEEKVQLLKVSHCSLLSCLETSDVLRLAVLCCL